VLSAAKTEDLTGEDSDDEGCEEGDDEDVGTPKCQSPQAPHIAGSKESEGKSNDSLLGLAASEPSTPKIVGQAEKEALSIEPAALSLGEMNRRYPLVPTAPPAVAATQCAIEPPLWQAAERTLTPLWELATNQSSSLASSSNVSKSNSELSVRACLGGTTGQGVPSCVSSQVVPPSTTRVLFTSKLSPGSGSSAGRRSSSPSSVLPISTASSTPTSSSRGRSSAASSGSVRPLPHQPHHQHLEATGSSDQSSWENTSLTDESVREELLSLSSERRRRRRRSAAGDKDQRNDDEDEEERREKRSSKESVITTTSEEDNIAADISSKSIVS